MKILRALNLKNILIAISIFLVGSNIYLKKKVDRLDNELGIAKSNIIQYENLVSQSKDNNRVLQLTIDDFRQSNDSLIQEIHKTKDSLKIKDKQLTQALSATTLLTDTITKVIPTKEKDFSVELKPNQLTTIKISRVDSILTCIPEIYNRQDLFVYKKKVWRNRRKNWFQRLIHFDFKKDLIENYQIINTNELIQVVDTRVINISK